MKRTTLLVAVLVVVGMIVVPATGALAQETETDDGNETAEMAPGERLGGVVGVQQAEFDGEIERNAFAIALDRADDNATKAGLIAEKLGQTETRLGELGERKADLQEKRENGTISEGQYRAQTAKMATEVETAKQQLNQSNATAAELPEETLRENGVNATAIRTLMDDANELSGGEVAEIARSIAGDRSGMVDRGAPGDNGPGADRADGENRSDDRPGADRQGDDDSEEQDQESDEQSDADQADEDEETTDEEQQDGSTADDGTDDDSAGGNSNAGDQ